MSAAMFNFSLDGISKYFFPPSRSQKLATDLNDPSSEDPSTRPIPPSQLPPLPDLQIEQLPDQRARALKHILKVNHINNAVLYHDLTFHNHVPHVLGSAYLLGASAPHLHDIYVAESEGLEGWSEAPGEISETDWREFLGKGPQYQRAWIDFFEDRLANTFGYDWEALMRFYLFSDAEAEGEHMRKFVGTERGGPLVSGLIGGLAHPLIHIAYGFELGSRQVAIEGLALACCCYEGWGKYSDDPGYTRALTERLKFTRTRYDVLEVLREDERFDGLFYRPGYENMEVVLEKREDVLLEFWNSWPDLEHDAKKGLEETQRLAVTLLVASDNNTTPSSTSTHDFLLVHLLTSTHAVRTLLPLVPGRFQLPLIKQWWLYCLTTYIAILRPSIDTQRIRDYDLKGRDWEFIRKTALGGDSAEEIRNAHYVKALRAMRDAAELWGDQDEFYLKAAVKYAEEFRGWKEASSAQSGNGKPNGE